MNLTTEDILKKKILDEQQNVRDYQQYSDKIDNKEINEMFKNFAEKSAYHAQTLQNLLKKHKR